MDPPGGKQVPAITEASENATAARHSISISYPRDAIDWIGARDTAGWAALQWQGLAWTKLDIRHRGSKRPLALSVDVRGAIQFATVPRDEAFTPGHFQWHLANYYSYDGDHIPHLIALDEQPGDYWFIVRPLYEVRVFGGFPPDTTPTVDLDVRLTLIESSSRHHLPTVITQGHLCIAPDVVEGRLASPYFSVALRNDDAGETWRIIDIHETYEQEPVFARLSLLRPPDEPSRAAAALVHPLQTTKVGFKAEAGRAMEALASSGEISVKLGLLIADQSGQEHVLIFTLSLGCVREPLSLDEHFSYRYTYLSKSCLGPHYAIVVPPRQWSQEGASNEQHQQPVIVALHGAGVETDSPFWRTSLPRHSTCWIVLPTGLTPWGLDWQQASRTMWQDLVSDLRFQQALLPSAVATTTPPPVVLLGHSNGGQGAWHGLVHGGEQVIAGIVCAGYIKMEDYVAPVWRAERHTIDPTLRGILESARTVFANDVHLSNLVAAKGPVPLTIKYGSEDDNVPPWHSREMGALLRTWASRSGLGKESWPKVIEVKGRGHWWDEMLREEDVQRAIDEACEHKKVKLPKRFTVTCVIPSTTRARNGWRIVQTEVPGRIARLEVEYRDAAAAEGSCCTVVAASNVRQIEVAATTGLSINIGSSTLQLAAGRQHRLVKVPRTSSTEWQLLDGSSPPPRLLCPVTLLLDTPSRFLLVQPTSVHAVDSRKAAYACISRRWAHDLLAYTTIPTHTIQDSDISSMSSSSSHVYLGGPDENLALSTVSGGTGIPFVTHLGSGQFKIRDRLFAEPGIGLLYSIPHRGHLDAEEGAQQRSVVLSGTDAEGIERAARLLPVRTGVPLPEWIVVGRDCDRFGMGGVLAAGWYDNQWGWSEAMSYLGD